MLFEVGAEGHAVAERGEVRKVAADDAVGVVGGAGKGETDGHGGLGQLCDYGGETFGERAEAAVEVVGVRGNRNGCDDEFAALHGAEYEVGATGIERDDDAIVVVVHRSGIGLIRLCDRTPGCRCAPVASRLSGSAGRRRGCGARAFVRRGGMRCRRYVRLCIALSTCKDR